MADSSVRWDKQLAPGARMQGGAGERGEHPRSRLPRLLLGSGSLFPLPSSTQRSSSQETCPSAASFPLVQVISRVRAGRGMGWEPETVWPGALSKEEDSGEHWWLSQTPRVCTWSPQQPLPHLAPRGEAPDGQLRTNLHPHMQPS